MGSAFCCVVQGPLPVPGTGIPELGSPVVLNLCGRGANRVMGAGQCLAHCIHMGVPRGSVWLPPNTISACPTTSGIPGKQTPLYPSCWSLAVLRSRGADRSQDVGRCPPAVTPAFSSVHASPCPSPHPASPSYTIRGTWQDFLMPKPMGTQATFVNQGSKGRVQRQSYLLLLFLLLFFLLSSPLPLLLLSPSSLSSSSSSPPSSSSSTSITSALLLLQDSQVLTEVNLQKSSIEGPYTILHR